MSEINNGDNKKWGSDLPLPNYVNTPSEIKPVYQIDVAKTGAWFECTPEQFKIIQSGDSELVDFRILYPAAAYEALQKENAELKAIISNLTKAYERESNDCLKALEERDYWYEKADSLADKISECFDVPIGEHSNVNCPIVESMKILSGEYVTKFCKESEAQAKRIAELETEIGWINSLQGDDVMYETILARAKQSYIRHKYSVRGQILTRDDDLQTHIIHAAIEYAASKNGE